MLPRCERGDVLLGRLLLDAGLADRRVRVPLSYEAPPPPPKTSETDDDDEEEDDDDASKSDDEKDAEALRDSVHAAKLRALKKLKGKDPRTRFDRLAADLAEERPRQGHALEAASSERRVSDRRASDRSVVVGDPVVWIHRRRDDPR